MRRRSRCLVIIAGAEEASNRFVNMYAQYVGLDRDSCKWILQVAYKKASVQDETR